jgi:methionyl-tRNA formyltransferase
MSKKGQSLVEAMRHGSNGQDASNGLNLLLYIGRFRPATKPDFSKILVDRIHRSRNRIAGIVVSEGDSLTKTFRRMGIPVFSLPQTLDRPKSKIRAVLRDNRLERKRFHAWLSRLAELKPDLGLVFYGGWLPSALVRVPKWGFVNYHPAPLPELRGVEPDTFCVLEGRKEIWGTVHTVSEGYDEGLIIGRTAKMRLTRYTTPVVIWHGLTELGIRAVLVALDRIRTRRVGFEVQDHSRATDAGRARAHRESLIRWSTDDLDMIRRRRLTYCGQDIRIRLKADVEGRRYCVRDLEIHRGRFVGRPGDKLGCYRGKGRFCGQPIVRARDGVVVLELGTEITAKSPSPAEPLARLVPPRRQAQQTDIRTVRSSLR